MCLWLPLSLAICWPIPSLIYMDNKTCIRITTRTGLIWWMCTNKVVQIAGRFIKVVHCRGLRPCWDVGSIIKKMVYATVLQRIIVCTTCCSLKTCLCGCESITFDLFFCAEVNLSSFQIRYGCLFLLIVNICRQKSANYWGGSPALGRRLW